MASFSEIISLFKDLPRQGNGNSNSNNYNDREIAAIINNYRAKIVNQKSSKGKNNIFIQSLGRVTLVKAPKIECMSLDEELGNCIFRTETTIPKVLSFQGNMLLSYVGTIDSLKSYQQTAYNKVQFKKYARFTSTHTQWYFKDGYIYIINPPTQNLKYITISGVFEKPEVVNEFNLCSGLECPIGFDFEYPMDASDIDTVFKMIAEVEYKAANMLPKDTLNNSSDAY